MDTSLERGADRGGSFEGAPSIEKDVRDMATVLVRAHDRPWHNQLLASGAGPFEVAHRDSPVVRVRDRADDLGAQKRVGVALALQPPVLAVDAAGDINSHRQGA